MKKAPQLRCFESYGYFAQKREYTHTLRLESELSDLRVGYANPCAHAEAVRFFDPARGIGKKKSTTNVVLFFLVTRTGIEPMFPA